MLWRKTLAFGTNARHNTKTNTSTDKASRFKRKHINDDTSKLSAALASDVNENWAIGEMQRILTTAAMAGVQNFIIPATASESPFIAHIEVPCIYIKENSET